MWSISFLKDPLVLGSRDPISGQHLIETKIVHASCTLQDNNIFPQTLWDDINTGRIATTALADYIARKLTQSYTHNQKQQQENNGVGTTYRLEPLDRTTIHHHQLHNRIHRASANNSTPFVLERTDIYVCNKNKVLNVYLRCFVCSTKESDAPTNAHDLFDSNTIQNAVIQLLNKHLEDQQALWKHIAVAVLQERLRLKLQNEKNAVAFVANGSILPRKSGASTAPMSSPPAIPFDAPSESVLRQTVEIDVGAELYPYIIQCLPNQQLPQSNNTTTTVIALTGLLIPRGVTLICGGGYHGKSTLLRCLAAGVYNKVIGDGREFCVTVDDAVTVRAEDGRYVNNCNVSAFISNLPTAALDTKKFSSGEASGSTSQAANVVEAIEMNASAMLVDEDVSAANFMARDGRMRSLVMDESITPLLYRVNGLYKSHGISSIVVVGGVGDWLDVPDAVILMDKYQCKDATAKARSISKQFSHGHVQYAGRGVVHRLNWPKSGTPIPRRPIDGNDFIYDIQRTAVTLLDGSDSILLEPIKSNNENDSEMDLSETGEEGEHYIDMSRCEQQMGKKPQLYGCGLCLVWLLNAARDNPEIGLGDLLKKLDEALNEKGLFDLIASCNSGDESNMSQSWQAMVEMMGCIYRPRRFEVGQALTRLRGIQMEEIPYEDDGIEAAEQAEAERKKQELLAIWNARRKNPLENIQAQQASSQQ